MLIYHLALDPYHGAVRVLRLFAINPGLRIEYEHLRILDFCLMFPEFIARARLPQALKAQARRSQRKGTQYSGLREATSAFRRVEPIQRQTVRILTSSGILNESSDLLEAGPRELPHELRQRVNVRNGEEADLMRLVAIDLASFGFRGRDGLKDRTGLLEFRYDSN